MAPAMPCKRQPSIVKTSVMPKIGNETEFKTMYDCIVESDESTRQRAESWQSKNHEDHMSGKGFTSVTHYNLVHKFMPMPQAMKIPDAKAAVGKKNGRSSRQFQHGIWQKFQLETQRKWQRR